MDELNSYQDSINPYIQSTGRTESDEDLQSYLDSISNQPPTGVTVERNAKGELQEAPQQPVEPKAQEPEMESPEETQERNLNLLEEAQDWVAEKVLGRSPEDSQKARDKAKEWEAGLNQQIEDAEGLDAVPREAVRAVTSGVDKTIQDGIGFANFAGDFTKTKLGMVEEDDEWNNVDHANYRGSERDLVMAEPTTKVGQYARDMISFVVMSRQLGSIGGAGQLGNNLTGSQKIVAVGAREAVLGATADFMLDPGDGNASNALQELVPSLKDNSILSAFAHQEEDNEFSRRLKNMAEGVVMQGAVDGIGLGMKAIWKGSKPLRTWLKANPGKKAADAPPEVMQQAVEAFQTEIDLGFVDEPISTKPPKTLTADDVFTELTDGDFSRADQLNATEIRSLVNDFELLDFISEREFFKSVDPSVALEAIGKGITTKKLPNGTEIDWIQTKLNPDDFRPASEINLDDLEGFPPDTIAGIRETAERSNRINAELQDQNIIRIDWDLESKSDPIKVDPSDPKIQQFAKEDWELKHRDRAWEDLSDAERLDHTEYLRQEGAFGYEEPPNIGSHGTKLYRQFGEVAKDQKPGTIIQAEAADDGFGDKGLSEAQARRRAERGIAVDENNIRERLYQRAGLSEPNEDGLMFGIVKYRPNGRKVLQPLDSTKPIQEQVDEAIESARQFELPIDFNSAEVRPGKFDRYVEDFENGGNRFRPDFEPYERAGKTAQFDFNEVAEQVEYNNAGPRFSPGAPNPYLTDNTIRQISEAGGDADIVKEAYQSSVDEILPKIKSRDPELQKQALEQINKYRKANAEDAVDMSALTEMVDEQGLPSPYLRTLLGNNVAKILIADTSNQLSELATAARQITDTGMDANRQYNLIFDRLKALTQLQVVDGSLRGSKLQALQGRLVGNTSEAAKKRVSDLHENIEQLRTRINEGDPAAKQEVKILADSLVLADGDGNMSMNFTEKFFKYGRDMFETTMYNSYLSGLVTQERNILGNAANVTLKPLSMMLGSIGQPEQFRAAASMYIGTLDSISEGFRVAKTSLANSGDKLNSTLEGVGTSQNMGMKLANMRQSAKTPGEKIMSTLLSAQYYMLAHPKLQMATRMLDATDRGFKVISARQKAKFDMVSLAFEDGIKFDPQKYELNLKTKIKDGEIVDEQLMKWAQVDTFQEDLSPFMTTVTDIIDRVPFLKYAMPFVKTPTNIIKQTAHYVPLLGRAFYMTGLGDKFFKEYTQVMKGTDEAAKAVYRGREGIGIMVGTTLLGLGFNGLATGAGPRDPQLRKAWDENNRPHSIKVGGVWVSNRFLGPIGILMSAYADIGMISANRGSYDKNADLFYQLVYTTAGSLFDQSFLDGLFSVMDTINDLSLGKFDNIDPDAWTANLLRAQTPYQAALRSWNNTLMPGIRDYNNNVDQYIAETFFQKNNLGAERISMRTGEPVASGGLSALNQIQPFSLAEVRNDPTIAKMIEYGIDVPLEFADKYKGVKLTATEHNEINKRFAKSGVWEDLQDYFDSRFFKKQYDDWKNSDNPIPRLKAEWYITAKNIILAGRTKAVNEYRNLPADEATPESIAFDQKVQAIEDRDFFGRKGNYYDASNAQTLIDLAN